MSRSFRNGLIEPSSHRAIEPVESGGTDNALFRLGADMALRLPRVDWAIGQVEKECEWLPALAPLLPLAVPVPLAKGVPAEGYPWHWSVCRWLEGENATLERLADPREAATELAGFIAALQRIDAAGGPLPDEHNSFRGVPLAMRDREMRAAIASLADTLDTDAAMRAWEAALERPRGPARPSGSTAISIPETCWPDGEGSAPSSISDAWAWAIPHAT